MVRTVLLFLLLAGMLPAPANAETIVLRGRNTITAPIVKTAPDAVFLDLGFDILRVPRKAIVEIRKDVPVDQAGRQTVVREKSLYATGDPNLFSTVAGVRKFGPAVVVVKSPGGIGSGFIVHEKGYLITNFHVVKGQKHLSVTQFVDTGPELIRIVHTDVRIVALDPFHDLAVLQIEKQADKKFPWVVLSPGEPLLGEKVFVIGNPLGLERTVTEGILSHTGRLFEGLLYLQVDASVNPGNSGGPLFNGRGQVIGVVNMGIPSMQGLNFAIPVQHVRFLLDHMDAFAYDKSNSESGFVYISAPPNPEKEKKPEEGEKKKQDKEPK